MFDLTKFFQHISFFYTVYIKKGDFFSFSKISDIFHHLYVNYEKLSLLLHHKYLIAKSYLYGGSLFSIVFTHQVLFQMNRFANVPFV